MWIPGFFPRDKPLKKAEREMWREYARIVYHLPDIEIAAIRYQVERLFMGILCGPVG
ncbi:hypothetical protein ES703_52269 [subsurface metagenome]